MIFESSNLAEMRYIGGDDAFGFFENDTQSSFGSSDFKTFHLSCTSLNLFSGVLVLLLVRIPNGVAVLQ